ncbi:MAG: trigger factor [Alphaproteobacteria bacterium]|nr:trigger factor [Alphaproteobacteria bacterium]
MNIKEIKTDALKKEFEVSIPFKEMEESFEQELQKIAATVRIDGFRPGKVPASLVKQRHGMKARQDSMSDLMKKAHDRILKEHALRPAMQPKYKSKESGEGKDFVFSITFELLPTISPVKLEDLKFDRYKTTVQKADVDALLEDFRERFNDTAPIEKARKTKDGDILLIDFTGKVNGKAFEGGTAKAYKLTLGSKSFIPGFEDQLIGRNVGEDVLVKVTFPEAYTKPLAGKAAEFDVKIHEIHEKKLPEINDEFVKNIGFKSLEELRSLLERTKQQDWDEMSYQYVKQDILNTLSDHYKTLELPETMVENEFRSICHRLHHHENKDEKHEHYSGEDFDKKCEGWRKEYFPIAERRVKLGLVLAEISNTEAITVRHKELEEAVWKQAQQYRGEEKKVLDYYKNNPEAVEQLRAPILEEKVIQHILDKAKVTEKKVSFEELKKMVEKRDEEMENAFRG